MAQRPWEILKSKYVPLEEAVDFMSKALKDLKSSVPHEASPVPKNKKRRVDTPSCPCSAEVLDSLNGLYRELQGSYNNKKKRKVLEPIQPKGQSDPTPFLFKKCIVRGLAQLLPLYLRHPDFGTKLFLSNFLLNFVPELGGVWVAFRKVRSTQDRGFIADAEKMGVICFRIDLEVLIFCPSPGATLLGTVRSIRPNGLQASVFETWDCEISRSQYTEGSEVLERADGKASQREDDADDEGGVSRLVAIERVIVVRDPLDPSASAKEISVGSSIKFMVLRSVCGVSDEGKDSYTLKGTMRRNPRLHQLKQVKSEPTEKP